MIPGIRNLIIQRNQDFVMIPAIILLLQIKGELSRKFDEFQV